MKKAAKRAEKIQEGWERKRLLLLAKKVNQKLYLRLLRVKGDDFTPSAKHGILAVLKHRYLHLEHYLQRMEERKMDVFLPSLELIKIPYKIKMAEISFGNHEIEEVLQLLKSVEHEIKLVAGR